MLHVAVLVSLVTTVLAGPDLPSYRLPLDVVPLHYHLEIVIDLQEFVFHGKVWITILCSNADGCSMVHLHSKDLIIDKNDFRIFKSNEKLDIEDVIWLPENDIFTVKPLKKLQTGETYSIYVPFTASLYAANEGFSAHTYGDSNSGSTKVYIFTNLKSKARSFFPCFDEPALRATFSLKVGHPKGLTAVSNTASISRKSKSQQGEASMKEDVVKPTEPTSQSKSAWEDKNLVWEQFEKTPVMSPHQVALVVSELYSEAITVGTGDKDSNHYAVDQRMWSYNRNFLKKLAENNILTSLISIIGFSLWEFFNQEFPFAKIDFVIVPGALYTPSLGIILTPEKMFKSPTVHLQDFKIIARDISSHWIGGEVGIKWWSDVWYSWALAEYIATMITDETYPNWNFENRMFYYHLEAIYKMDEIDSFALSTEDIFKHGYMDVAIEKGSVLMRMVHKFLDDKVFKQGLRNFVKQYRGGSAGYLDLWRCLTDEAKLQNVLVGEQTVENIMVEWVTQPGFPLVTVTREYNTGIVSVSQSRFTKNKDIKLDGCWTIPITYYSGKEAQLQPKDWLSCQERDIQLTLTAGPEDWIVFNNKINGLYRVNYDISNWKLIARALDQQGHSKIQPMNRVQLLTDAMDFAKIGLLDYQTAFTVIQYLRHEYSYLPWKAAFWRIKYIKEQMFRTAKYSVFKNFVRNLMGNLFTRFMDYPDKTDEAERALKEIYKWPCEFDVEYCIWGAVSIFQGFKAAYKNNENPVSKNLRRISYCKGVEQGTMEDWEFMKKYFYKSEEVDERKNVLVALTCTTNVTALERYLEWSISKEAPIPQDFCAYGFRKMAAKEAGFPVAWKFLFNNVQKINDYLPGYDTVRFHIQALASRVADKEELEKLETLAKQNENMILSKDKLEEVFQTARERLNWINQNAETIITTITEMGP